jgi:GNAT superfamily N-acetyltransferase
MSHEPSSSVVPILRTATAHDAHQIDALMKASIAALFPGAYTADQTAASIRYIGSVDRTLIADGTYVVFDLNGEIVACGGWSRRDKLYTGSGDAADDARLLDPATEPARIRAMFTRADWTRRGLGRQILAACEDAARAEGFTRLALMATLPGLQLYEACGYTVDERVDIRMPDGTTIAGASMHKALE